MTQKSDSDATFYRASGVEGNALHVSEPSRDGLIQPGTHWIVRDRAHLARLREAGESATLVEYEVESRGAMVPVTLMRAKR